MVIMREAIFILLLNIEFNIAHYWGGVKEVIPNVNKKVGADNYPPLLFFLFISFIFHVHMEIFGFVVVKDF